MSEPGPSMPPADVPRTVVREPATACPVEGPAMEGQMADDTPWARFYRQQAERAGEATVGRLLDSWKTRQGAGHRGADVGEGRSLQR